MAVYGLGLKAPLAALIAGALFAGPAAAETRGYVVTWFTQANNSVEGDCPGGINPPIDKQYAKNLAALGYSPAEVARMMEAYVDGGKGEQVVAELMEKRARVNGKPANAYAHPAAVADPHLTSVDYKYEYGFNLDGMGEKSPNSFEDPITHEKGVNNQASRALGCVEQFRGTLAVRPSLWVFRWTSVRETAPAWLLSITGENLDKDGPVTIRFDRAMEHMLFNGDGEARADVTYRADPDERNHHAFKGEIKNGVVTITEHGHLTLLQDQLSSPIFNLDKVHLRLNQKADGGLDGFLAGYQPWHELYFLLAQGGSSSETNTVGEIPGMYHAMRRLADASPDPKTGMNMAISVTYRLELVPAFIAGVSHSPASAGAGSQ